MTQQHTQSAPRLGRPTGENKSNAARRRHQLIEATIDSIVQNGLAGTTLATVAANAGLSQGVAVFYFKNKQQLLLQTLCAHYDEYQTAWQTAVKDAGSDPLDKIITLISVSLTNPMSTPRQLALWFAFWGEVKARPQYAQIAASYEKVRVSALCKLCEEAKDYLKHTGWTPQILAQTSDALADGFLLKMHISQDDFSAEQARNLLGEFLVLVFPQHKARVQKILGSSR